MYKIFKSNEIKEIEKKISIPDKKIEPQKKAKVNVDVECNSEEAKKLFDSIIEEAQEEADRIFESTSSLLETKRHAIISDAKEDAIQIKNSAESEANSIIEKAKLEAISGAASPLNTSVQTLSTAAKYLPTPSANVPSICSLVTLPDRIASRGVAFQSYSLSLRIVPSVTATA